MTYKELYHICYDEAVAYANSEQWSKRTGEQKSFLIQGYLDAMMKMRKSEITEKKKEYPKTYKEYCDVLGLSTMDNDAQGYKAMLIIRFQELLIARDAYWKIAGEEMGLGKPWEPDWSDCENIKYIIGGYGGEIGKGQSHNIHITLAFPTPEMRDAFYENFKELIESVKELL